VPRFSPTYLKETQQEPCPATDSFGTRIVLNSGPLACLLGMADGCVCWVPPLHPKFSVEVWLVTGGTQWATAPVAPASKKSSSSSKKEDENESPK